MDGKFKCLTERVKSEYLEKGYGTIQNYLSGKIKYKHLARVHSIVHIVVAVYLGRVYFSLFDLSKLDDFLLAEYIPLKAKIFETIDFTVIPAAFFCYLAVDGLVSLRKGSPWYLSASLAYKLQKKLTRSEEKKKEIDSKLERMLAKRDQLIF